MNDLTGQRFGKLIVIRPLETDNRGYKHYLCQCDCGNQKEVSSRGLRRGSTKSCGCYRSEISRNKAIRLLDQTTHGMSKTRLYHIYYGMKARCYNPNNHKYKNYGGRGITICDEWMNSFESFRDWSLANGYRDDLSIDRINSDGNYEPSNCRWADNITQENNRTNNTIYEYKNIFHTQKEWCELLGCNRSTITRAIKRGLTFEQFIENYEAGQRVIELLKGE